MFIKKSLLGLILLLGLGSLMPPSGWGQAQCFEHITLDEMLCPILNSVEIQATVRSDRESSLFTYDYTLTNPPTNTGKIGSIDLDISFPQGGDALSSEGLRVHRFRRFDGTEKILSFEEAILPFTHTPHVPVGLEIPEKGWIGGLTVFGTAGWGSDEESGILPGQSLSGFELFSRGLPAIRNVRVDPSFLVGGDITDEEARAFKDELAFKGKSLGPTAPPANFIALDFLAHLVDLRRQATELAWITNKGVEKSLDAKLDNARKKLEKGKTKAAANALEAFLHEVSAQGCENYDDCPPGRHLLPEARALLFFNGQFLLDRL